jgi:hypothetical protein
MNEPVHKFRVLLTLIAFSSLAGCRRLPDAPQSLEELTNYLFVHFEDDNDLALQAGVINTHDWLALNFKEANTGYRVQDLSIDAVDNLGIDPVLEGQVGVAVGYDVQANTEALMNVIVTVDGNDMDPEHYLLYDRTFLTDPNCFLSGECDFLSYTLESISTYPLSLEVRAWNTTEIRRVPFGGQSAYILRNWMTAPAEINVDWIAFDQQYYISTILPCEAATRRLDAGWIVADFGLLPIPEEVIVSLAVDSMLDAGMATADYLAEHGTD